MVWLFVCDNAVSDVYHALHIDTTFRICRRTTGQRPMVMVWYGLCDFVEAFAWMQRHVAWSVDR